MKKSTDELLKILKNAPDIHTYLEQEEENLTTLPLHQYLETLFSEKGISPSDCIRRCGLDRTYCYQIFSGTKQPSRDKVLALCFGLSLDFEETQLLLKKTGYPQLYPRNERDSMIIFALQRHTSITDLNELLFDGGYQILK